MSLWKTRNWCTSRLIENNQPQKEMQEVVRTIRASSAPEPSGIPYKVYKCCPELLQIFGSCCVQSGTDFHHAVGFAESWGLDSERRKFLRHWAVISITVQCWSQELFQHLVLAADWLSAQEQIYWHISTEGRNTRDARLRQTHGCSYPVHKGNSWRKSRSGCVVAVQRPINKNLVCISLSSEPTCRPHPLYQETDGHSKGWRESSSWQGWALSLPNPGHLCRVSVKFHF